MAENTGVVSIISSAFNNTVAKFRAAVKTFREHDLMAILPETVEFGEFQARRLRYEILWAMHENSQYSNIHKWAQAYKNRYGLYRAIRGIYNPTYRLNEFWRGMIWGGTLDLDNAKEGAIPIKVGEKANDEQLRKAIVAVWKKSNWAVKKGTTALWGSAMGDVGLRIVDDVKGERVFIELVHPSTIKYVSMEQGFVKGYELEYPRNLNGKAVTYTEKVYREENTENVVFETYADGKLYPWDNEQGEKWSEPYGFVPFVFIQHDDVGAGWGWSEVHADRAKVNEMDDLASKLHDQIRKSVDPVWLYNFTKPKRDPDLTGAAPTKDKPQPIREESPALYIGEPTARGQALVATVDIASTLATIKELQSELERDFPELQMDIWAASGDTSGVALSKAREKVEKKVIERRASYDDGLVRAHQMAIAIGGDAGYEGFGGYGLDSFKLGKLDHSIDAKRPIFSESEEAIVAKKKAFWEAVDAASTAAGGEVPLEVILEDFGWDKTKIENFLKNKQDNINKRKALLGQGGKAINQNNGEAVMLDANGNPIKQGTMMNSNGGNNGSGQSDQSAQ